MSIITVEAKFTTAGMTKGKRYDVIQKLDSIDSVVIALDDGIIAVRRMCAFDIVDSKDIMPEVKYKNLMMKCSFCAASDSNGICKWSIYNMPGSKEADCNKAIERMMETLKK